MKKVLFATTALVASAGIASAQGVEVSGYAEMGIIGGDRYATTQFHTDIDVTFTMSGETDNGLTFGASIDLDESSTSSAFGNTTQGGETIFLSGNFGTITMGDTDGAFDWALTEAIIGGSINDDHEHAGYNGNAGLDGTYDGQIARYDYSFGDFAFAVSAEIDDTGVGDPVFGIGGKYTGDLGGIALGVGLGYQQNGVNDILGISLDATFSNGIQAIINYSDLDGQAYTNTGLGVIARPIDTHMGLALGYSMDALTVAVNYGVFDGGAAGDLTGYGLVANYDLGGGAVVQFGYGYSEDTAVGGLDSNQFSLGVAMSF